MSAGEKATQDITPFINVEDELPNNGVVHNKQQRISAPPVAPANTSLEPTASQPTVAPTMSTTWFSSPNALHTSQTSPKFVNQTNVSPPRSAPQSVNRSPSQSVSSSHVGLGLQLGLTAIDYPGQVFSFAFSFFSPPASHPGSFPNLTSVYSLCVCHFAPTRRIER